MALTLFLYAQSQKISTSQRADLSVYADEDKVADWPALLWSGPCLRVCWPPHGGRKTVLDPTGNVTRAEFAAVLKTLCQDVLA
mgnify:CR=1 FL=1